MSDNGTYMAAVDLDDLVPSRVNVNRLSDAKLEVLVRAIGEGMRDPVEICHLTPEFTEFTVRGKYLIVDGHHRVEAARRAKLKQVPALLFNYTEREARVRMLQTNTLRGQVVREQAARLVQTLDISDRELGALAGIRSDEVKKLRELKPRAQELPPPNADKWEVLHIALTAEMMGIVRTAMKAATRRLNESRELVPINEFADWLVRAEDIARAYPDQFFWVLLQAIVHLETEMGRAAPLVGPAAKAFRRCLEKAKFLAETESDGRALELVAADFLSGVEGESYG